MGFTHLHVHSEYSILDSSARIEELVKACKDCGMDSLAITDHGVMYGVIQFYKTCVKYGIKPIIGCEMYISPGSRFEKSGKEERYYHLLLLAKNEQGFHNLKKLVSLSFVEGFYYKPRIDKELLSQYSEGIICLSACMSGEVAKKILARDYEGAKKTALEYKKIFGADYYLELQDHGAMEDKLIIKQLLRLSKECDIPLVVTNDVHYVKKEDSQARDILTCIGQQKKLNELKGEAGREEYYFKTEEELRALFPYAEEAIDNAYRIGQMCDVKITFGVPKLPKYDVPNGISAYDYLYKLSHEGLIRRYDDKASEYSDRLDMELGVISKMGYVDYFLVVWDFINYARSKDIPVGDGRGSAAGSLVAYALGITNIDPMRFNLYFERFLNPERVSMPDIDIDFAHDRRDEVVRYVIDKYGSDRVVQIASYGTLASKAVIRDVVRVLDLGYGLGDELSKMIPGLSDISLDMALNEIPEFRYRYDTDPVVYELINIARKLEGLPRHTTTHPAGVVICDETASDIFALSVTGDGNVVMQCNKKEVEQLGLLKIDFLSLRNLTVIDDAIKMIKNRDKYFDIGNISYEDSDVYSLISSGDTDGVFQLESRGMKRFIKKLRPRKLEEIIAGLALFRPGPMDFIPQYIRGKENPESVTYEHPLLKPILQETYGCIVYQEQVMRIVRELAGYSLGRSDLVRRAMTDKNPAVMEKERKNFVYGNGEEGIRGCVSNNIDPKLANHIFDEMIDFASYAFNKSHAAAYSVIAYKTAYLKYHYPLEFMASLMTSVIGRSDKIAEYSASVIRHGGRIFPPSVNEPSRYFSVVDGGIRYGLGGIKGVGDGIIDHIIGEYCERPYRDFYDFVDRNIAGGLNKKNMECLIKSGALDNLGANRRQMLLGFEKVMDDIQDRKKRMITGQMSLFDYGDETSDELSEERLVAFEEFDRETFLAMEVEVLGIYVSGHPLDEFRENIEKNVTHYSSDFIIDAEDVTSIKDQEKAIIGGIITGVNIRITKKGEQMATFTLKDLYGNIDVVVFPKAYGTFKRLLVEGARVFVLGRIRVDGERAQVVALDFIELNKMPKLMQLGFADREAYISLEKEVSKTLRKGNGDGSVEIFLIKERERKFWAMNIDITDEKISAMKKLLGEDRVIVKDAKLGRRLANL